MINAREILKKRSLKRIKTNEERAHNSIIFAAFF